MTQFQYKAVTPDGTVARGRAAEDPDCSAAAAHLQSQGHLPLTLVEESNPRRAACGRCCRWRSEKDGSADPGSRRSRWPHCPAAAGRSCARNRPGPALGLERSRSRQGYGSRAASKAPWRRQPLRRHVRTGGYLFAPSWSPWCEQARAAARWTHGRAIGRSSCACRSRAPIHPIRADLSGCAAGTAIGAVLLVLLVVLPQLEPVFAEAGNRLP